MKKIILFVFSCLLTSQGFAQSGYVKHIFEIGKSSTIFQNWESLDMSYHPTPITDIAYTFFANKNIGISLNYHISTGEIIKEAKEKYKYLVPGEEYYYSRYINDRRINCWDIMASYRAKYRKHSIQGVLGLTHRRDRYHEHYINPYWGLSSTPHEFRSIGYAIAMSYQFRVVRNFGISAESVFRSSKNIPNTFTYGIKLSYLIWNKRKEKKAEGSEK